MCEWIVVQLPQREIVFLPSLDEGSTRLIYCIRLVGKFHMKSFCLLNFTYTNNLKDKRKIFYE